MSVTYALVRAPAASYVNAMMQTPQPIDYALALAQHAEYVTALQATGASVEILPPAARFPDACFMQDPALVIAGLAILARMGTISRAGEVALAADALGTRFPICEIAAPATLEGGDVLITGKRVLVGETERTNAAGIAQLRAFLAPRGVTVEAVPVRDCLHLLTVVTCIGENTIVVLEDFAEHPQLGDFEKVTVKRGEAYAANALGIGKHVILPAGFPDATAQLEARGFEVLAVPMSEFYKADGGVSCLSLIF